MVDIEKEVSDEFLITKEFHTSVEFSQHIETLAKQRKIGCLEVILEYCERKDIDTSSIAQLISSSLKEKIRVEAEELNLMKRKSGTLPL